MSRTLICFSIALLPVLGCSDPKNTPQSPEVAFYLGTYTEGESEGIYKFVLAEDGSLKNGGLMARAENPSFLTLSADGRYLLAVNEVSNENQMGYVSSFKIGQDTLELVGRETSGGAHPCHIATNPEGFVVVANYSGGNMGLLKTGADGSLSELLDVQQHEGRGEHPRQEAPHAHSGWFADDGSVVSVDLGTNQLWFSTIDPDSGRFLPGTPPTLSMDPGAGPRHLAFHPERPWMYVVNELSSSVSLVKKDPDGSGYSIAQTLSTLPEGFSGENTCADIHVSPDGNFLYASNRGHHSIAIFSVDPENGTLTALGHEPTRGETPRNFNLSPDGRYLLVANQTTNSLVSFSRDPKTGLLAFVDQVEAPSPVCILFAP
jgi:6-phosphogluconolactonase